MSCSGEKPLPYLAGSSWDCVNGMLSRVDIGEGGEGSGVGRGEAAVPVCARCLSLWVPHLLGACSSLVASFAHGPQALRLQPPPLPHTQGAGSSQCEVSAGRPAGKRGPLWPDGGHRLQGVPGDMSLPLGTLGGSGPSPPLPTPNSFKRA